MLEPINIVLNKKFLEKGIIILNFVIMIEIGKKYKKIAKGDLKLLTKYFLDGKNIYENWINIKPFTRQLENLGVQSDLLQNDKGNGKIYATIELKDPLDEFKKKVGVFGEAPNPDLGVGQNENFLKKMEFNDNLSDVSISILDTKEEDREGLELEQFIEYEYIEGLKLLLQNDYKNILPNDFVKLRQLNEILYGKYIDLSNAYNETLYSISSLNEEIRQQAKKYYEEYKLLKKDVYNGRIELKKQSEELQLEIKDNNKENSDIKEEMEKYINEKKQFKSLLGINEEEENKKEQKEEEKDNTSYENDMLINLLKNLSSQGYDIFKGANLTEEEMKLIEGTFDMNNVNENENINQKVENIINSSEKKESDINNMNNNNMNSEKKENAEINPEEEKIEKEDNAPDNKNEENGEEMEEYDYDNEDIKENFELGNQVVSLIEKDVNDLYLKKIIEQIKIDQINAITYTFEKESDDNPHEITLKIENGELFCIDGTKFSAWLIKNFSAQ
jgi:hypothetical protein